MTRLEEQLGRLFADMEAEQERVSVAEIVGDPPDEGHGPASRSPRRGLMLVAAVFAAMAVGWAVVVVLAGDGRPEPVGPVDVSTVPSTMAPSTVPPEGVATGVDHRSYFSVDDALRYSDEIRIGDEAASRAEIAQLLAGGEGLDGTDPDSVPNLVFATDTENQDRVDQLQQLWSPTCADYRVGGVLGFGGGGGYPPGLVGAFQMIADGGDLVPDWVYVDWYDDDLSYDEATALLDEAVLSWIIARGYVFARGYSGSKIAVTLSPTPTAPWNQAVLDHPFVHPAVIGDDLVDAVCETFDRIDPL